MLGVLRMRERRDQRDGVVGQRRQPRRVAVIFVAVALGEGVKTGAFRRGIPRALQRGIEGTRGSFQTPVPSNWAFSPAPEIAEATPPSASACSGRNTASTLGASRMRSRDRSGGLARRVARDGRRTLAPARAASLLNSATATLA